MPSNWTNNVTFVSDGEPVDSSVTNTAPIAIDGNTRYLRDRLDSAQLGTSVVAVEVTASPLVQLGQPVFFNTTTQQFEQAKAAVTYDSATGTCIMAPSADCLGVCLYQHSSTLIDVLLAGSQPLNVSAAVTGTVTPGRYYLSSATPGMLVQQAPAVSVPVLFLDSDGNVYVNPAPRDFLSEHVHYSFELYCLPAGTTSPPEAGSVHVITADNISLPGWLNANNTIFNGLAPVGAAFGYNLAQHPQLNAVWPPIPVASAHLFLDTGQGLGASLVPLGLLGGMAVLDQNGIWWMSNCYGRVPWPTSYNSDAPPSPPSADTAPPTCPPQEFMSLLLSYGVDIYASKGGVVTSLISQTPWLTVTNPTGGAATAGALALNGNLDLAVNASDVAGSEVLKTFVSGQFNKGFVTEGIQLSGTGLVATATQTSTLNAAPLYQGVVTLGTNPTPANAELGAYIVRESSTDDRVYYNVPFLVFPNGQSSALYLTYNVPAAGLNNSPTLALNLWLMGLATGTLPALTVTYRRLAMPSAGAQVVLATTDTVMTINTNVAITAYSYVLVSGTAFTVAPGDVVLVSIVRAIGDGYSGDVGLLRYSATLSGITA